VNLKGFPRLRDKDIEAATDGDQYTFPWALMNDVFSGRIKDMSDYRDRLSSEQKHGIDFYTQGIRDYQFPVQVIQERDYPTAGNIFSRVNSQGTQLTGAEIHIASIIPHWRGIASEFRRYRRDLRKGGYDLDLTFLMRAITVIACDVPQIKKLVDKVSQKNLTKRQLNRLWAESKRAINVVVRTLREDLSRQNEILLVEERSGPSRVLRGQVLQKQKSSRPQSNDEILPGIAVRRSLQRCCRHCAAERFEVPLGTKHAAKARLARAPGGCSGRSEARIPRPESQPPAHCWGAIQECDAPINVRCNAKKGGHRFWHLWCPAIRPNSARRRA
jgi:hypothetical protein